MKTKVLIKENNLLQKQLDLVNEAYYEQVIIYTRAQALLKPDEIVEQMLLDVLRDILAAQKEGQAAKYVFGDARELVNNTLAEIPNMSLVSMLKYYWIAIIVGLAAQLWTPVTDLLTNHRVYGANMLTSIAFQIIILFFIYRYRQKFATMLLQNNKWLFFYGIMTTVIMVGGFWLIDLITKNSLIIRF